VTPANQKFLVFLSVCLFLMKSMSPHAAAQNSSLTQAGNYPDHIMIQPKYSTGKKRIRCRILDYTGAVVTVHLMEGDTRKTYATSEVTRVETPQSAQHRKGLTLLDAGEIPQAEEQLLEAYRLDPREWVQREILAHLVRAALQRGDYVTAATRIEKIFSSDEHTQHLELLPAIWTTKVLNPSQIRNGAELLVSDSDIAQFVGASILLEQSGFEETAKTALLTIQTSGHRRLKLLAEAQLWRLEFANSEFPVYTIDKWKRHIERLPTELRGGPYFLLARAYQFKLLRDDAALTYLRIPVLYDHDRLLAAEASLAAADVLRSGGRNQESLTIYRELVARYQGTEAARKADAILKSFAE
jgi:tetratricopeptide (TPR) repeat protein